MQRVQASLYDALTLVTPASARVPNTTPTTRRSPSAWHLMSVRYSHGSNTLHSWVYRNSFSFSDTIKTKSFNTPTHPENKSSCVCHYRLYSRTHTHTNCSPSSSKITDVSSRRLHVSTCPREAQSVLVTLSHFALVSSRLIYRFSSDEGNMPTDQQTVQGWPFFKNKTVILLTNNIKDFIGFKTQECK